MTRRSRLMTLGIALAVALPAPAGAALLDRVGVYADYWRQTMDGEGRIDGNSQGTEFSLQDDLGMEDDEDVVEVGAWFHPFGRHRLRVSGFSASYKGAGTLSRTLDVGNTTLLPGQAVVSRLDLDLYKGHYNYAFINSDMVNFGALVGVDYVNSDGAVAFTGGEESAHLRGPVPVVGLSLQVSPPLLKFFRVYGEASGASWKVGDIEADVRDLLARVEFYVAHVFGVGAGYRKLRLKAVEDGSGKIDLDMDGYQVYLLLRF